MDLGPHKYAYVHGDPITGIDPSGLFVRFSVSGMLGTIGTIGNIGRFAAQQLPAISVAAVRAAPAFAGRLPTKPFALHFGGSQLTDSHLEQLKRFHGAEYLGLNRTSISDTGLPHILAFSDIKCLDLGYADVGDEGMESLSKAPKLRTLILFAPRK